MTGPVPVLAGGPAARVRGTAAGLLAMVVGLGLLLQLDRSRAWTDPAGTVAYVVAAALLVVVVRPRCAPWLAAGVAGAAATAIELTQRRGGPGDWVPRSGPLRVLFGSTFTAADLCWIVAGTAVAWLAVRLVALRGMAAPQTGADEDAAVGEPTGVPGGERFPVLPTTLHRSLRGQPGPDRPRWQAGLAIAAAGVVVMLLGGIAGWAIEDSGRRIPGLVEWAPTVAGLAVLAVGLLDAWRGLSRDDRLPDARAVGLRTAAGLALASGALAVSVGIIGAARATSLPVVVAVVTALGLVTTVLLAAVAGWGDGVPQRGRAAVGALTAAATLALALGVPGAPHPASDWPAPPSTATRPAPAGPAATPYPSVVVPSPAATRTPAPDAPTDVPLCRVEQLQAHTRGWDAAMGDTAVTVVVTNTGGRDCAVQGLPTISLLQGRSPVRLRIDHESIDHPGRPDRPRRALVRAGGEVRVALLWAGYRNQADERTTQALTLHAPGVGSIPVALDQGPAPFDLMDGGTVSVSGWR